MGDLVTGHAVGHRIARPLMGDLVTGRARERFDLGEEFRAAQLRLLGISGPDEVEVDVRRRAAAARDEAG